MLKTNEMGHCRKQDGGSLLVVVQAFEIPWWCFVAKLPLELFINSCVA